MSEKLKELKESFDQHVSFAAELSLELINSTEILGKNQVKRVFLASMEYPMKPSKALISEDEIAVYKLAVALKEKQMSMGILNLAMADLEKQDKESEDASSSL